MRWSSFVIGFCLLVVVGCDGLIGEPGVSLSSDEPTPTDPAITPVACDQGVPQVAPAQLRRLTPAQIVNTVRDLVGDPGYRPTVDDGTAIITERGVRQLRDAAELVVSRQAQWTVPVYPCDTSGPADEACAVELIDTFGPRAFRGPVTDDDREWLMGVYADALAEGTFAEAMDIVLQVILQSPRFLYLYEEGEPVPGLPDAIRRLNDHELAARLSYFLWNTMPDEELRRAADAGELVEGDGLVTQVERLLADPRSEATVQRFVWQWLQLDGGRLHHPLEETAKDSELFPEYDPALQTSMRVELEALVREVLIEGEGSFSELLTTRRAYVDDRMAQLYGVSGPADGAGVWVDLPEGERSGLLTRAAFLTVFASAKVHSPIRRGVFVVEEVLCNELGEPPPNASDVPVEGGEVDNGAGGTVLRSVRDDVVVRTQAGDCNACHGVINPIGFTFEHYDAIGRYRTEELGTGLPIDSSGTLQGSDVDGDVRDANELSERLAGSAQVRTCFAERWMETAVGRRPGELDHCSEESITDRFAATGNLRDLIVAIVESDAFRYVNLSELSE